MGGRALDHRQKHEDKARSSSRTKSAKNPPQDSSGSERSVRKTRGERDRGRVGQLDERNLKRAVHRYGTLPKGARIGAYLESLRVMTPEPVSDETDGHDTLDSHKSGHTDPGKKSVAADATPAMARSNSSHGGFPGAGSSQRPRPLGTNLPRRLPTYTQAAPNSPATNRHRPSALPELDFPPPPADLPGTPPAPHKPLAASASDSCDSVPSFSDAASLRLGGVSPLPPMATSPPPQQTPQQQLVREITETTAAEAVCPEEPPPPPTTENHSTPATQLVNELFESLKAKTSPGLHQDAPTAASAATKQEDSPPLARVTDFKAGLRPVTRPAHEPKPEPSTPDFKFQLKKVNSDLYTAPAGSSGSREQKEEDQGNILDFKSQLRKVNKPVSSENLALAEGGEQEKIPLRTSLRRVTDPSRKCNENGVDKEGVCDSKSSVERILKSDNNDNNTSAVNEEDDLDGEEEEEEDRRKSSGSISSLVKMWETEDSPVYPDDRPGSVVKFEKRVWPPIPSSELEKPMVPVKPTVKPPPTSKPPPPKEPAFKPPAKPITTAKPPVCNIYAAPR